jgi:hypothetical protein
VPYDTVITATIEGDTYTTETPSEYGAASYALKIEPPAGTVYTDGTPITFKIDDNKAVNTAIWTSGGNIELDLYDALTPVRSVDIHVSDSSTLVAFSSDNKEYEPYKNAVATWVHPDWPTIDGATWISSSYKIEQAVTWSFRKFEESFAIPADAFDLSSTLEITADYGYNVQLNDIEIGADIITSSIETITIEPVIGENTLNILVHNPGRWGASRQENPTGLIYKLTVAYYTFPIPPSSPTPTPLPTISPTPVLTPTPTPPLTPPRTPTSTPGEASSLDMGKILGIAILSIADVLLIGLLIWLVWRFFLQPKEQQ